MKNLYKIEDELYIVSSSEKIKENTQSFKQGLNGDWFYNTIYNFIARTGDITPYDFKIILTTNKLLIKDGVQAINDEFLEWFVNNPSCEFVKVEEIKCTGQCWKFIESDYEDTCLSGCELKVEYKIIIPKEEVKPILGVDFEFSIDDEGMSIEVPITKQETLEEGFGRIDKEIDYQEFDFPSFKLGVKWQQENSNENALDFEIDALKKEIKVLKHQQERSYSEDRVDLLHKAIITHLDDNEAERIVNYWFEQFKKK